jgi:pSer/pThr/pTyr-binding forkhead associated (FHA) protein
MTDLVLTALRLVFLGLLVLFVLQVARSMASHVGPMTRAPRRSVSEVVIVRSETQAGATFRIKDALTFGRSDDADVLLDDPYASEFHLRFSAEEDRLVLQDLGSTNGTYLNGRRVTAPVTVAKGDAVQVGKTVMEIR